MEDPVSRVTLDEYLVAAAGQLMNAGWGDGHPVLMVLDLFGKRLPSWLKALSS